LIEGYLELDERQAPAAQLKLGDAVLKKLEALGYID
jgi:hypothetical protein